MPTVQIRDANPNHFLAFDLKEILVALGPDALVASWTVNHVISGNGNEPFDATGEGAAALEQLAQSGEQIIGTRLAAIAHKVTQIIWGTFTGHKGALSDAPWVTITAYDSSWYEVQAEDEAVLNRIRAAFRQVNSV